MTCDPDVQRVRLTGRGTAPADADQRVRAQAGLAGRLAPHATLILDTSGTEAQTKALVEDALREALDARR